MEYFKGWENKEKQKQFLRSLHAHAPLYASDKTIKLAYGFVQSLDRDLPKNEKERQEIYGELTLEIRKEMMKLNGDYTELTKEDFIVWKLNQNE